MLNRVLAKGRKVTNGGDGGDGVKFNGSLCPLFKFKLSTSVQDIVDPFPQGLCSIFISFFYLQLLPLNWLFPPQHRDMRGTQKINNPP